MSAPRLDPNDPGAAQDLLDLAYVTGSDIRVAAVVIAACIVAGILLALLLL